MSKNHHGSPKEILGANGQPVMAERDDKTYIETFLPNKDLVLVRMRNEAGIALPEQITTSGCPFADIIEAGPSCKLAKVGCRCFVAGGCTAWKIPYKGRSDHYLVREGDLFGIVNPEADHFGWSAKRFETNVVEFRNDTGNYDSTVATAKDYLAKAGLGGT